MEIITTVFNFFLHIDTHLGQIINNYGTLSYLILFSTIFVETGLVFFPFLPGDSLLFAAGAFATLGSFNIFFLLVLLWIAAFAGDSVNYWIGRKFGQKLIANPRIPINQEHIDKTQQFYNKHGSKTIFLARFVPIVRTFAPFMAGIGKMHYPNFLNYNATGALAWIIGVTLLGYFFGNIPFIKDNFSIAVLAIVILSILPLLYELITSKHNQPHNQESI